MRGAEYRRCCRREICCLLPTDSRGPTPEAPVVRQQISGDVDVGHASIVAVHGRDEHPEVII